MKCDGSEFCELRALSSHGGYRRLISFGRSHDTELSGRCDVNGAASHFRIADPHDVGGRRCGANPDDRTLAGDAAVANVNVVAAGGEVSSGIRTNGNVIAA